MIFDNKKRNVFEINRTAEFKKERLSAEALDHFAETYEEKDPSKLGRMSFNYTKLDGTQIKISDSVYFSTDRKAKKHFEYLLSQTLPYHQPDDIQHLWFYLRDLMYIVDEKGKQIMWTTQKTHLVQFVKLAEYQNLLFLSDLGKQDPKNPRYTRIPHLTPVTHIEEEHPVPGEEK